MLSNRLSRTGRSVWPVVQKALAKSSGQLKFSQAAQPAGCVRGSASLMASKGPFPIVMMGSGNVMFGTIDGPWNHSLRFERKLAQRLQVAAIIDPNTQRAQDVLSRKLSSPDTASYYRSTRVCAHISDLPSTQPPRLVVIGTPPVSRGMDIPGRDLELQVIQHFPGVPMFVEKPISTGAVPAAWRVAHIIAQKGVMCSVGYMLRYLKAVQRMKQIIQDNNLTVMGTNSRYYGAYTNGVRLDWWDKSREQGPIIEQATHFCDLARYFAGDVDLGTVAARTVEWHERPGKLSRLPIDEDNLITPENRIPRSTSAIWKYTSGAIGSMTHSTILQGTKYACEFEVYCDGYTMRLSDPYGVPVLGIRQAGQDDEVVERYEDDDPFYSEVSNLIDTIEEVQDRGPAMLSTYQDACRTYELTWAIRDASERVSAKLG